MIPRSRVILLSICAILFFAAMAKGQGTRLWSQSKFDELEKGKPEGVAITSDGHLVAGPESKLIHTTPSTYVWSIATDRAGNASLATGTPASVLKVTPDGKSTKLFSTKELTVQAVCVGADGAVYAAVLPSGKVYKLDAQVENRTEDNAALVFDPATTDEKPKYVWDLAFDREGRLYIAAGGPAGIYRVAPGSKPELFFKSDEQHIRTLEFDAAGNLIAGSDGTGLVYRIDKTGKGYVIFDAPKREITSVAVAPNGAVYAAAVGEKGRSNLPPLPVTGTATVTATITIVQPGSVQAFSGNTLVPDGSEIYEIAPNGAPHKLWANRDDVVYALRWTREGLLASTGNRGRVYRIQESGGYADVAHLEASQATGFADSPGGIYIGTANTGKVYLMSHEVAASGTYTSDVFDAGVFSQWGRTEVDTGAGSNAKNFDFFARAGNVDNPQRAWSEWKKVSPNVGPLGLDPARFIQWKAELHNGADIGSVGINYLPVNVAPVVDEIVVVPGARANPAAMGVPQQQATTINFPPQQNPNVISFNQEPGREPLPAQKDKSAVTVRWLAHDENGDDLSFSVYYRGDGEENWQMLKDKIAERYVSFDGGLLPDGPYRLKVVASDAPSHNPGEALTGERVSDRFVIDTTPPVVADLTAKLVNGKIHVTLTATDAATPISHAEYSVDAGPWQYVEPVGRISDALTERFEFDAPLNPPAPGAAAPVNANEHVITVRVYDRNDNAVAAKAVVR
jgi:hypothetical protein